MRPQVSLEVARLGVSLHAPLVRAVVDNSFPLGPGPLPSRLGRGLSGFGRLLRRADATRRGGHKG